MRRWLFLCAWLVGCQRAPAAEPVVVVPAVSSSSLAPRAAAPSVHVERPRAERRAVMVMLDVSASMNAVMPDVPVPSVTPPRKATRLDVAKLVVDALVRGAPDDEVGVALFAREAFVIVPFAADRPALHRRVEQVRFNQVDPSGTAVGGALLMGASALRRRDERAKIVVVVSDADPGNEGVPVDEAARVLAALPVRVVTIQIGQPGEAEVQSGVDLFGVPVFSRHKFDGDPALFQRLAATHGGRHWIVADGASFADVTASALAP